MQWRKLGYNDGHYYIDTRMKCIFPAVFVPFPMRLRDHLVKSADAFAETEFVEDEENVVAKSSI